MAYSIKQGYSPLCHVEVAKLHEDVAYVSLLVFGLDGLCDSQLVLEELHDEGSDVASYSKYAARS